MTDRELMQQALDALNHVNVQDRVQIITALRERLAQPEPAPTVEFDHGIGADRFKVVRGAYWWHILIGDSPIKRGKFHTKAGAEEMVVLLLREFRNGAFVQHNTAPPQRKPLEGVIDVQPIGYHSLQLIFRSQTDIAKFKSAHGIKEQS